MPINKLYGSFFENDIALPKDPHILKHGEQLRTDPMGLAPMHRHGKGYHGTIVDRNIDTHTYTIALSIGDGIAHKEGVGRLIQDPGEKRMLPIGARVALTEDYGPLIITGCLPYTLDRQNNENRLSLTGESGTGSDDPLEQNKPSAANFRTQNTPRDLGPNDWAQIGEENNAIAVLGGGLNIIKSSPLSQIRTHLVKDMVEIISRNFRHITDMGISEIKNDGGRITWSFRGGADQLTEAGSDQENWVIRIDLGAEGDLFRFELTRPDGGSNFKFHVNSNGRLTLFASNGIDETSGTHKRQTILGNHTVNIKGREQKTIRNDQSHTIYGNQLTTLSGSCTQNIANDQAINIMRHRVETIGGVHQETVSGGNPATQKPGDLARQTTLNAGWEINIGNPLSGSNPAALPGFTLNTYTGNITQNVKGQGNILLSTVLGNATLETTAGIATLKSRAGLANVDGTTVHLGPLTASTQPLVKGLPFTTAFTTFTSSHASAFAPAIAATSALLGTLTPAPLSGSALIPWVSALLKCFSSTLSAHTTLATALAQTLSTKSFTS